MPGGIDQDAARPEFAVDQSVFGSRIPIRPGHHIKCGKIFMLDPPTWGGELMLSFERLDFGRVEFMTGISESVAQLHDPPFGGPYIYTRDIGLNLTTRVIGGVAASAWFPTTIERWRNSDGSGRLVRREYPPEFSSTGAAGIWGEADAVLHDVQVIDRPVRAGEYSTLKDVWEGIMPLSHNPESLSRQLMSVSGGSAQALLGTVRDIYYDLGVVEASLRAAILRVLAGAEGLRLAGIASDKSGREVFGVSAQADGQGVQFTLIFDPATGELNAHQEVLVKRAEKLDLEPPGLLSYGERQVWGRTWDTGSHP
ncbi:hypothetical protein [Streptomyces xylophagus]|uniref:hypothetical protein n=1 Tax=Streptomyces xylophagus TaxID=285514 RepID=UPI001F31972C|nr:hypothetical protein [Streptomyces xylophagus]